MTTRDRRKAWLALLRTKHESWGMFTDRIRLKDGGVTIRTKVCGLHECDSELAALADRNKYIKARYSGWAFYWRMSRNEVQREERKQLAIRKLAAEKHNQDAAMAKVAKYWAAWQLGEKRECSIVVSYQKDYRPEVVAKFTEYSIRLEKRCGLSLSNLFVINCIGGVVSAQTLR